MFCTRCGKELQEDWVKCPYCGKEPELRGPYSKVKKEIQKGENDMERLANIDVKDNAKIAAFPEREFETEDVYVLFKEYKGKKREIFNKIVYWICNIVMIWAGLLILKHIISEFRDEEHYKFIIYVARFFNTCTSYCIISGIADEIQMVIKLQKKQIQQGYSENKVLVLRFVGMILGIVGMRFLETAASTREWEILIAAAGDSYIDYFRIFEEGIICMILSGVAWYFSNKGMEKDEAE